MSTKYYPAIAERVTGEKLWSITFPDFPGVTSVAETFGEIASKAEEALESCIDSMIESGSDFPEERIYQPEICHFKIRIKLDDVSIKRMEINKKLNNIKAKRDLLIAPAHAQAKDDAIEVMKEIFDGFFGEYPEVETVYWSQAFYDDGIFEIGDIMFSPMPFEEIIDADYDNKLTIEEKNIKGAFFNGYTNASDELEEATGKILNLIVGIESYLKSMIGEAFIRVHAGGIVVID